MGLFSRKEAASTSKRRSSPSEAQAEDLRGRARQRLIGALALVVAAVIVVPLLLKTESDVQPETPVVVPAVPPVPQPSMALGEPPEGGVADPESDGYTVDTPALPVPEPINQTPAEPEAPSAPTEVAQAQPEPAQPEPKPEPQPKPEPKPQPKPEPKPAPSERTDDGSVALALLEGRQPPAAKPAPAATRGNFVVQIAAYTNQKDAQARRDSLVSAGVTNAYVETASPDGKTTYRLRVGPFQTREAAQAAQTRLRSLDYVNSFIASQ